MIQNEETFISNMHHEDKIAVNDGDAYQLNFNKMHKKLPVRTNF